MSKLHRVFLAGAVWFFAGSASAQVNQGSVRLWIDTDLFTFQNTTLEDEGSKQTEKQISFGPGNPTMQDLLPGYVGLGVGYVAHPHIIPSLHFAFGLSSVKHEYEFEGQSEPGDEYKLGVFMLRPELEVPFNPGDRTVVGAIVGLDFRQTKLTEEDEGGDFEGTMRGIGPVVGVGAHFFLSETVSIDVSTQLVVNFLSEEVDGPDFEGESDPDTYRMISLGILVGLSAWP